jgi:hypothetical protein
MTSHRGLLVGLAVVGLVACSDARPAKAPEPTATPAAAPATTAMPADDRVRSEGQPKAAGAVSSADTAGDLAAIASAEAQINTLAAAGGEKKKADAPAKGGAAGPRAQAETGGATSCSSACSALGSMTRATDHLCALTGEVDARCTDARARTRTAEAKVKTSCTC